MPEGVLTIVIYDCRESVDCLLSRIEGGRGGRGSGGQGMGKLGIVDSAPDVVQFDRSRYSSNFTLRGSHKMRNS